VKFLLLLGKRLARLRALEGQLADPEQQISALSSISHEAHKIAGTAGTFGFARLGISGRKTEAAIIAFLRDNSDEDIPKSLRFCIRDLLKEAADCIPLAKK